MIHNTNLKKILIILVAIPVLFSLLWIISSHFRDARAEQYLAENTLLGAKKAAVMTPNSAKVRLKIGEYYEREGDFSEAEKEFIKIEKICDNCAEFKQAYYNLRKMRVQTALKNNDISSAQAALAEAYELYPDDETLRFYYGMILSVQEDYSGAIENLKDDMQNAELESQRQILLSSLQKSLSLNAKSYTLMSLGLAFSKTDYRGLAAIFFEKATKENSHYRDAFVLLGKTYLQRLADSDQGLGDVLNKAKEALERAAEIDPTYPETYQLLTQVYEKMGDAQKAKEAAEKATMLNNNSNLKSQNAK